MSILKQTWNDNFEELDLSEDGPHLETSNIKYTYRNYIKNSSIHGLKYTTSGELHKIEKWFWIICLVVSFCIFIPLLTTILNRWSDSPVIIGLAEKPQPIWNIPFPAVTICPETKSKAALLNFTEMYQLMSYDEATISNLTDDKLSRLRAISHVCDAHVTDGLELNQTVTDENLFKDLKKIAPSFDEVLFYCKVRNRVDLCTNYFSEVLTEDGICFTYNILNSTHMFRIPSGLPPISHNLSSENWNSETGYKKIMPLDNISYPYRVHSGGHRGGIFILLRLFEYDFDYICRGPVVGFKVLLHSPDELPQISKQYFRVPVKIETRVVVKPNVFEISDELKSYEPERRRCYLKSENQLEFFKEYTQSNCELECLSKFIINKCGCAKFSMPKHPNTPICGASNVTCYHNAEDELLDKNFVDGISSDTSDCNCFPACNSIDYELEVSHAELDWKSLFRAYKSDENEFPGMQNARLSIVFKDNFYTPTKRYVMQDHTEMLAYCAALLAFFFGASVLSIVEVIYHFTFRWLFSRHAYRRQPVSQEFSITNSQLN